MLVKYVSKPMDETSVVAHDKLQLSDMTDEWDETRHLS